MRGILRQVKNGDTVVVDGRDGHVLINPDAETLSAYLKLQREFFDLKDTLAENRDLPAVTADGAAWSCWPTSTAWRDAKPPWRWAPRASGLFRTEYLFLTHPDVPDEEAAARRLSRDHRGQPEPPGDHSHARHGGRQDDSLSGPHPRGESVHGLAIDPPVVRASRSFSSSRSARSCVRRPTRNGPPSRVRMMFPMITTLEEMRRVRTMVKQGRASNSRKKASRMAT